MSGELGEGTPKLALLLEYRAELPQPPAVTALDETIESASKQGLIDFLTREVRKAERKEDEARENGEGPNVWHNIHTRCLLWYYEGRLPEWLFIKKNGVLCSRAYLDILENTVDEWGQYFNHNIGEVFEAHRSLVESMKLARTQELEILHLALQDDNLQNRSKEQINKLILAIESVPGTYCRTDIIELVAIASPFDDPKVFAFCHSDEQDWSPSWKRARWITAWNPVTVASMYYRGREEDRREGDTTPRTHDFTASAIKRHKEGQFTHPSEAFSLTGDHEGRHSLQSDYIVPNILEINPRSDIAEYIAGGRTDRQNLWAEVVFTSVQELLEESIIDSEYRERRENARYQAFPRLTRVLAEILANRLYQYPLNENNNLIETWAKFDAMLIGNALDISQMDGFESWSEAEKVRLLFARQICSVFGENPKQVTSLDGIKKYMPQLEHEYTEFAARKIRSTSSG